MIWAQTIARVIEITTLSAGAGEISKNNLEI